MQNNREHIDDLLKEKLQSMQFDFKEDHWADAARRLDEEGKKKKPLWWLFVAVVLLVGAGLTAITQINRSDSDRHLYKNKANNVNVKKAKVQKKENNITALDIEKSNEIINSNNASSNRNERNSNDENTDNASERNSNANKQKIISSTLVQSTSKKLEANRNRSNQSAKNDYASEENPIARSAKSDKKNANKKEDKLTPEKIGGIDESNKKSIASSNEKAKNDGLKEEVSKGENGIASTNSEPKLKNKNTVANKEIVQAGKTRIYRTPEDYQKLNPRYVPNLENYTYTVSAIPLSQQKSDSIKKVLSNQISKVAESKNSKKTEKAEPFVQAPSGMYLFGGLGFARGYVGNMNANPNWSFSPALGLGYERTFSDRMSLYLSLYMSYLSNLNVKETSTNITYSFDRDSTLIGVTRKKLLQLHLPIQFAYKLKPRLSVLGGFGLNMSLNSISLYEDSKQSSAQNQFGYMNGFQFLDMNGNIGVEYAFTPQLRIGAMYQQGLMDMTTNNYFNNQQKDLNARFGVYLRYKLKK